MSGRNTTDPRVTRSPDDKSVTFASSRVHPITDDLKKVVLEEDVPCGVCVTTEYFDADMKLVRRDIEIKVKEGFLNDSATGSNDKKES